MKTEDILKRIKSCSAMTKRLALLMVGIVLLAGALLAFGIVPQMKRCASLSEAFEEANATFNQMHQNISAIGEKRKAVAEAEAQLKALSERGVLVPLHNSYEMRALLLVSPLAEKAGVELVQNSVRALQRVTVQTLPLAQGRAYGRQAIEFSGSGSYSQIAAFVSLIEKQLPMASVASLRILTQRTPELHAMSISIEWPVVMPEEPKQEEGKKK